MSSFDEFEKIMRENDLVVRAIPQKGRSIMEASHAKEYPAGEVKEVPGFNRPMLVVETKPKNAGNFIVAQQHDTLMQTHFKPTKYYESLEEILGDWGESVEDSDNPDYLIAAEEESEKQLPATVFFINGEDDMNAAVDELVKKGYAPEDLHVFPANEEI